MTKLVAAPYFKRAKHMAIYISQRSEVDTRSLLRRALAMGKKVFVPSVDPHRKALRFFPIRSLSRDLQKGHYGVLEPKPNLKVPASTKHLDLIVLPGLGFDRRGGRLGRGQGYFDRFLKKVRRVRKVGLAFDAQILKKIPMTSHDVYLDGVITESGEVA